LEPKIEPDLAGDLRKNDPTRAQSALRDTSPSFEEAGSPVTTDGEHSKSRFETYPLGGVANVAPDGVVIPFEDGHTRQLARLTPGQFHSGTRASAYNPRPGA